MAPNFAQRSAIGRDVLQALDRRDMTAQQLADALDVPLADVRKTMTQLREQGRVTKVKCVAREWTWSREWDPT